MNNFTNTDTRGIYRGVCRDSQCESVQNTFAKIDSVAAAAAESFILLISYFLWNWKKKLMARYGTSNLLGILGSSSYKCTSNYPVYLCSVTYLLNEELLTLYYLPFYFE